MVQIYTSKISLDYQIKFLEYAVNKFRRVKRRIEHFQRRKGRKHSYIFLFQNQMCEIRFLRFHLTITVVCRTYEKSVSTPLNCNAYYTIGGMSKKKSRTDQWAKNFITSDVRNVVPRDLFITKKDEWKNITESEVTMTEEDCRTRRWRAEKPKPVAQAASDKNLVGNAAGRRSVTRSKRTAEAFWEVEIRLEGPDGRVSKAERTREERRDVKSCTARSKHCVRRALSARQYVMRAE